MSKNNDDVKPVLINDDLCDAADDDDYDNVSGFANVDNYNNCVDDDIDIDYDDHNNGADGDNYFIMMMTVMINNNYDYHSFYLLIVITLL